MTLQSVTDPRGNTASDAYNADNDAPESVTAGGMSASYTYANDALTSTQLCSLRAIPIRSPPVSNNTPTLRYINGTWYYVERGVLSRNAKLHFNFRCTYYRVVNGVVVF